MSLFQLGEFTLSSGRSSNFKIDCDALSDDDIETLAAVASTVVGAFGRVESVPTGGDRLTEAMRPYADAERCPHHILIVDDVLTTGRSMEAMRDRLFIHGVIRGLVIFSRVPLVPTWITPIFRMGEPV